MVEIVNAKEVAVWSPKPNFGFIQKRRFLKFLEEQGYNGKYWIHDVLIHLSAVKVVRKRVVSTSSLNELLKKGKITEFPNKRGFVMETDLKEIGEFDGITIYFLGNVKSMGRVFHE